MTQTEKDGRASAIVTHHDVVCLGCGCLCDDIVVEVQDGRIAALRNTCELGEAWFRQPLADAATDANTPQCWIDGQPASLSDGITRAAEILTAARYPLVCGLAGETCEAQSLASAIADRIGGVIDPTSDYDNGAAVLALLQAGQATCTLGELRHRSQTIVFWNCDPALTHPRHFERYSLDAPGNFISGPRQCIVVASDPDNLTAKRATEFFQITPHSDFACLAVLRAMLQNIELDAEVVRQQTGVELPRWQTLCRQLQSVHYGAIVFGEGLTTSPAARPAMQWLFQFVRELQSTTRFVCLGLRGGDNGLGAENVLASRTGYPLAVDHSQKYPRFGPHQWQAETLLSRGEVDAALVLNDDLLKEISDEAKSHLKSIPFVLIASAVNDSSPPSRGILFRTSIAGLQVAGSACRMDDVLLPLRPPLTSSLPSAAEILAKLDLAIQDQLR